MAYYFGKGLTGNILDAYNQSVGGVPATTKAPSASPTATGVPTITNRDPTYEECIDQCNEQYRSNIQNGMPYSEADEKLTLCKQNCEDTTGGGGDGGDGGDEDKSPCAGNGYLIPDNQQATPSCPETHTMKKGSNDKWWCCEANPPTEICEGGYLAPADGNCKTGETATKINGVWYCCPNKVVKKTECAGGYKLADSPLAMGGGSIWSDDWLPASAGWYRDPGAEAGWVWHPDWGYQWVADVYKYVAGQKTLTANKAKSVCRKGFKSTVINNEDWCCPEGGDGGGEDNYWGWPEEMVDFYKLLVGRGKDLLGRPLGWSPEEQAGYFGQNFENVRGAEAGTRQNLMDILSRQGMLGTGQELSTMGNLAWNTENQISDLQRQLFLENEAQKRQDLTNYTTLANMLFGSGMNYNTMIEQINAARRGEGNTFMNWLMNWFLANKNA